MLQDSRQFVGIDFGTTNSAVGLARGSAAPRLATLATPTAERVPTWRTLLYFDPYAERTEDSVSAGALAIERYMQNDGEGRLIQSIKSYLASGLFTRTHINGRTWSLEELVAGFLVRVRRAVETDLGRRAVVGRPVRYWGAETAEDDQRAVARMRAALALAGFDEVLFEYEPVAAAARYAATLDHEELVLIADFGGGTSDFSIVRVGPAIETGEHEAILASGGIGVGGDTFDGRIVDRVIAPLLGKGSRFRVELGGEMPVPPWLYVHLRRWHHLSFLKSRKTTQLLERIETGACEPEKIRRLRRVVEDDLGLPLHGAVERAKIEMSDEPEAELRFVEPGVAFSRAIDRSELEGWIAADVERIERVVEQVLEDAGTRASDIDRVFATGGSSFVPAIRALLASRFGTDRVVGGDELTSVAWGLAIRARALFSG